ncbi:Ktr system potassium uptake protein B [Gottschalkia acidurici 9a]|uniref:Ktr system potassium uptake protein B n=1 Tax=Gottschalkia acidurici (strain ATCC 7906 / DSM 604 / BCRC 14475 / CIP 104303 / KCTC 5404 / NCIMB 10678 / 9a) TaxID=1128398 RepID=K0AZZ5_GOTA9|nr:TrkH family potassium uptake protein [Gottschalkia acidurici]AFS77926.1 Ktr system potassium uptake protein B [Gottschalkia acidurici 9a]
MQKPALVLSLGIAAIMLIGAILLNLPISSNNGQSIGFLNALLTATSAVSVTGLVVVNTAEHWTIFGKVVIILLIQAGGLGFMTLATLVALITGKRIGLKERLIMQEQLNQDSLSGIVKLTRFAILATLAIEGIGALLLSTRLIPIYGPIKGIGYSVFHAISAFCNAGFDLFGDSLVPFVGDTVMNLTIGGLIILGGLGYTVYIDIKQRKSYRMLSLHSKIVLIVSALLIVVGGVVIFISEHNNPNTMGNLTLYEKVLASFFQSVVARTAGFYSIDLNGMVNSSVFFLIILMFIGGSPGSTAGGIKTTTFATIVLTLISVIRGKEDVEVFKKRIPQWHISKAFILLSAGLTLVLVVAFLLTMTEPTKPFIDLLFETMSAFATVGSTRNITPELSDMGKLLITFTMYSGKVGFLTLALALTNRGKGTPNKKNYKYPEGKIIIG